MLYSLLSEQNVEFDHDKPFVRTFYENCFKITLTVLKFDFFAFIAILGV